MIVYLCGPITGHPSDFEWRTLATQLLHDGGAEVLDPLRGKDAAKISADGLCYDGKLADPGFALRDRQDVQRCDALLCCVQRLPPTRPLWGTPWELGWASAWGKRIVIATVFVSLGQHLFTVAFAEAVFAEIEDAVAAILAPRKE